MVVRRSASLRPRLAAAFALVALAACSDPPGVVIDEVPAPTILELILDQDDYVGSPAIAVLPDGTYVASHDIFGGGSTQETSGITRIFRSTDRGASWIQTATLDGQFWSTLFEHQGAVYIMGPTASDTAVRDLVIRRSDDAGATWTEPLDSTSGLLRDGSPGGTPSRPVVHDGRLWVALGTRLASAPVGADLLRADSWTLSNAVPQDESWLDGRFEFWSEGQVAASPEQGVVLLPKVNGLPYTGVIRATSPSTLAFDPAEFAELPGAEKKFGATYDPVSGRFLALTNPVLPAHVDPDAPIPRKPQLVRNTAALVTSENLVDWDVAYLFLYGKHIQFEAFQYLNPAIEGDDLLVASRTAFFVGGNLPPRGHDSNLMTFHRVPGFRDARPRHVLSVDPESGALVRHEITQHDPASLGAFALGDRFDGAPLTDPVALGQDTDGTVYVRERGGRVLAFDATGNFRATVAAAPVPLAAPPLELAPPPTDERSWVGRFESTRWAEPTSWFYWGRPDSPAELAIFGSAATKATTVTLERELTVRGLRFDALPGYTLAGTGRLTLGDDALPAVLEAWRGDHRVELPVALGADGTAHVAAGATLTLAGGLDEAGHVLAVTGGGELIVQ